MTKPDVSDADVPKAARSIKSYAIQIAATATFAIFGAVGGFGLGKMAKTMNVELSAQSIAAFGLSIGLGLIGVLIVLFAIMGKMIVFDGQAYKLSQKERSSYALQGVVLLLGVAMVTLVASGRLIGLTGLAGFGLVAGLMALQTVLNVWVWRTSDELIRRVTVEAGAFCFWLLQGCLFLYAAAEQFGLVPTVSAWSLTLALMTVYLISSTVIVIRRGLAH